jgi:hypothetical protein
MRKTQISHEAKKFFLEKATLDKSAFPQEFYFLVGRLDLFFNMVELPP